MDHRNSHDIRDRDWIVRCFARETPRSVLPGDHALNPGTGPEGPLVPASVLIPVIDRGEGMSLLFTRRTGHLETHAGQISFPGGRAGPGDRDAEETALRECEEETGIARSHMEVLGRLGQYVTRTGFDVTPVAALLTPPFELDLDAHEVAEAFEAPLDFFLDAANHQKCSHEFEGRERYFYAMPYTDHYIWGATAGILMNFYEFLREG